MKTINAIINAHITLVNINYPSNEAILVTKLFITNYIHANILIGKANANILVFHFQVLPNYIHANILIGKANANILLFHYQVLPKGFDHRFLCVHKYACNNSFITYWNASACFLLDSISGKFACICCHIWFDTQRFSCEQLS